MFSAPLRNQLQFCLLRNSTVLQFFETSHAKLLVLDPIVVLSVQETQDSVVPFPHAGSVRSERRKAAGELLLGIKCR